MSQKRRRTLSPPASSTAPNIYGSSAVKDRDSTFIGHFSPTLPTKDLQAQPDIASATHRMAAWRVPSKQSSIQPGAPRPSVTGHDDDGEKWAGQKLEKVLQEERVHGAVVVARWYGGVMLGPVRFTWIEKCAREAIAAWRAAVEDVERESKRRKADEDAIVRLRRDLPGRDKSIAVLRQLLAEKVKERSGPPAVVASVFAATTPSSSDRSSLTKLIEYGTMPVEVLRRLEKARDTTIALLLRKIDETEKTPLDPG